MSTTATEPTAVLAYGTLRPGWHNFGLVEDLGPDAWPATVEGYGLWVPRHRGFPYAWPADPGGIPRTLVGEVLRFSPDDWPEARRRMDRLEGHPIHYRRHVVWTTDGEAVWLYVATEHPLDAYGAWCLASGDWADLDGTRRPVPQEGP
jgi:gamma-glutamylcyclotransferase (GGCT)/AIG2-like uncharacterized protein YtfP